MCYEVIMPSNSVVFHPVWKKLDIYVRENVRTSTQDLRSTTLRTKYRFLWESEWFTLKLKKVYILLKRCRSLDKSYSPIILYVAHENTGSVCWSMFRLLRQVCTKCIELIQHTRWIYWTDHSWFSITCQETKFHETFMLKNTRGALQLLEVKTWASVLLYSILLSHFLRVSDKRCTSLLRI